MYQLYVLLVLACIAVINAKYPEEHSELAVKLFKDWKAEHEKTYRSDVEEWYRYGVFLNNVKAINSLNGLPKKHESDSARYGLTKFADLTIAEFKKTILQPPRPSFDWEKPVRKFNHSVKAPASFDWTNQEGVVTSVKDQGSVGTCWAFAGLANVESLWKLKSGQTVDLSAQSLNDCDGIVDLQTSALACGPLGATMPGFYEFVIKEGGIMRWSDYPYCVGSGDCSPCAPEGYSELYCGGPWPIVPCYAQESCAAKYDPAKFVSGLKVTDYGAFSSDEEALLGNLVDVGPLVAGIDASDLQFYEGGILEPVLCSAASLNHAVLLVGYDETSDGTPYWRIKNSWGVRWGEEGFGRIIRGVGACGVNAEITTAVLG